jgi:hypothetical protein
METIKYNGQNIEVKEISRPVWGAILFKSSASRDMYVEYVASTGPYKIDILNTYKLSVNEVMQYHSHTLDLTFLCKKLMSYAA